MAGLEAKLDAGRSCDSQDPRTYASPRLENGASARANPEPQDKWQMIKPRRRWFPYAEHPPAE